MFNDEMIANGVERVCVQAGRVGLFQPFVEFQIEDLKALGLGGANFRLISRQPRGVVRRRTGQQTDGFKGCFHGRQLFKSRFQNGDG